MNRTDAQIPKGAPLKQGLYDPSFEREACGVGFVVNIKGRQSHQIVKHALTVLVNLSHRGACGAEENTGDGAGLLIQLPHKFFAKVAAEQGFSLPSSGQSGVGMLFLPQTRIPPILKRVWRLSSRKKVRISSDGAPCRRTIPGR